MRSNEDRWKKKSHQHGEAKGFCHCVVVHKGIAILFSLFRTHWLCVAYCLVLYQLLCTGTRGQNPSESKFGERSLGKLNNCLNNGIICLLKTKKLVQHY